MSEIPDVIPGEPIESDWGNDVRDRAITRYADATARDLSLPFPEAGAVTWIDSPGTLEVFDGVSWLVVHDGPDIGVSILNAIGDGITLADENTIQRIRIGPVPEDSIAIRDAAGALVATLNAIGLTVETVVVSPNFQMKAPTGAIQDALGQNRIVIHETADIELRNQANATLVRVNEDYATAIDNASDSARNILVGTVVPDNAWGKDGDVFLRYIP